LVLLTAATSFATRIPNSSTDSIPLEAADGAAEIGVVTPTITPNALMTDEIEARIAAHKVFADGMTERAQAASGAERLAIQKQVQEAAAEMQMDILRIQARYAREAGREELVQKIEASIAARDEAMANPRMVAPVQKAERQPSFDREAATAGQPARGTGQNGFGEGGER
jgi:hypothetical protein